MTSSYLDARRAVFAPLDDGRLRREAVVERLSSAVALGLMGEGDQLPSEAALAASLNVSTVTLREALSDLRWRGLIETRRGRSGGSFIRASPEGLGAMTRTRLEQLATADLRELGDFRATVSGGAAQFAAARASTTDVDRMRELILQLEAAEDPREQLRLDSRHYVEIAACAQSVRLTTAEMSIQSEAVQLPWTMTERPERLAETVAAHREVIEAIGRRDGNAARRGTETHLQNRTTWLVQMRIQQVADREQ